MVRTTGLRFFRGAEWCFLCHGVGLHPGRQRQQWILQREMGRDRVVIRVPADPAGCQFPVRTLRRFAWSDLLLVAGRVHCRWFLPGSKRACVRRPLERSHVDAADAPDAKGQDRQRLGHLVPLPETLHRGGARESASRYHRHRHDRRDPRPADQCCSAPQALCRTVERIPVVDQVGTYSRWSAGDTDLDSAR